MSRHPMHDTILFLELVQLMPHQSLLYNWFPGSAAKFCTYLLCRKAYIVSRFGTQQSIYLVILERLGGTATGTGSLQECEESQLSTLLWKSQQNVSKQINQTLVHLSSALWCPIVMIYFTTNSDFLHTLHCVRKRYSCYLLKWDSIYPISQIRFSTCSTPEKISERICALVLIHVPD